jgi:hypothetical protein
LVDRVLARQHSRASASVGALFFVKWPASYSEQRNGCPTLRTLGGLTVSEAEAMRIFLLAMTACMMLLAAMPTMAQDCTAIRRACVRSCLGGTGATGDLSQVMRVVPGRVKACINRCSIAPCEQTPLAARLCDTTAQRICTNGFRACSGACIPSTATTAAEIESQASCSTFCCSQLKACLAQRKCNISTITAITCQ